MMTQEIDYSYQYKKWHQPTEEHAAVQALSYRRYLENLGLRKDAHVLDVGCGMGFFVRGALSYGIKNVQGIDASPQQVSAASSQGLPVEHVADTMKWLLERPATFDAIFLFDVLEHVPVSEQISSLRAIHAALKPGGTLLLRVPNANASFGLRFRFIDWTHHCSFTEHSLDFVFYNSGFRKIEIAEDSAARTGLRRWIPNVRGLVRLAFRSIRRLEAIAEFGLAEGAAIPLTLNLVGIARKEA